MSGAMRSVVWQRLRRVLIGWIAGWPTLTLVLYCTQPFSYDWPLPLRALVSAAAMATMMNLISVPLVTGLMDVALRPRPVMSSSERSDQRTA